MLSGITAFPVYGELNWLMQQHFFSDDLFGNWLRTIWKGVQAMHDHYPMLFYGYDWLAFAHIAIAMAFIGPYKDPVRNRWVIEWAMLCCIAVLPLAFIAGPLRHIPWFHILIDCSFGVIGIIPLAMVRRWIGQLQLLAKD